MFRSPQRSESRKRRVVCALTLALGLPLAAQAQDTAYVDSPAGRRMVDPARADGGSVAPGTVFVRPGSGGPGAMTPMMQMQMQMLGMSIANSQRQAAADQAAAAAGAEGGSEGMPQGGAFGGMGGMGGMPMGAMPGGAMPSSGAGMGSALPRGMGSGMQPAPPTGYGQAQPTPMQQIGAGMVQDAGNLMDAGVRRSVYGDDAAIMVPAPGTATVDGGGW